MSGKTSFGDENRKLCSVYFHRFKIVTKYFESFIISILDRIRCSSKDTTLALCFTTFKVVAKLKTLRVYNYATGSTHDNMYKVHYKHTHERNARGSLRHTSTALSTALMRMLTDKRSRENVIVLREHSSPRTSSTVACRTTSGCMCLWALAGMPGLIIVLNKACACQWERRWTFYRRYITISSPSAPAVRVYSRSQLALSQSVKEKNNSVVCPKKKKEANKEEISSVFFVIDIHMCTVREVRTMAGISMENSQSSRMHMNVAVP